MTLPPLSSDLLKQSDEIAGRELYDRWIRFQAEKYRVPITLAGAGIAAATASMDTDRIDNIALVKALSLAANGDFARAGKLIKEYVLSLGQREVLERRAKLGTRIRKRSREAAKRLNDSKSKAKADKEHRWREIGEPIRAKHPWKSNSWLAEQIAKKTGDKMQTVRKAIPRLGLGPRK